MTATGRITVLVNPASGHGSAAHAAERAIAQFHRRGVDVVAIAGFDAVHARRLVEGALESGMDGLVVVGGDGIVALALQVLAQTVNDLHYDNPRDRALAMAAAVNEDILEVDAMGVDFIQLDEFTWPYFFEPWAIDAFNRAVQGVQHAQIICHVCWGNWGGTPAYMPDETAQAGEIFDLTERRGEAPSATASIIPKAYEGAMNVLNLENCGRRSDDLSGLDVIKNHPLPNGMMFWAGVIDVKSTITETAEQVADRIHRLLEYVPAEQLGVTTDCGLILLQRYIAIDKLHALVAGTELVRKALR